MKGFKINTKERKIEVIEIQTWKDIARNIGNECTMFTAPVVFDNEDTIYSDDEGLYHPFEGGFMMKDWSYPIVGNSLLIGTDDEGDSSDVKTTLEELESMVIWVDKAKCEAWARQF
jgi:hypothetical protein